MAPILTATSIGYAVVGGYVPAFVWLYIWLREESHPEPKQLLFYAFLSGMAAIPCALVMEVIWQTLIVLVGTSAGVTETLLIVGYAFIEEIVKFILVYAVIFWRKEFSQPLDAMIYLMTAALGFASLENVLYLAPEFASSIKFGLETANLRFVGATLLHALSSGILGFYIAHNFCKGDAERRIGFLTGIILATLLHAVFNLTMLSSIGNSLRPIVLLLSATGIFIIFAFDHIKAMHETCPLHGEEA